MLKSGELEIRAGLYYISEKGYFESVYGKYQYFDYDGKGDVTDVREHEKKLRKKEDLKK